MASKAATTTTTGTTSNGSPRDSTDSESPVEEAAKATDAKRLLKRNQQRDFRRKVNQQLEFLRGRVAELEAELQTRKKGRSMLLPWSHVEQALRHDLAECQAANKDLNATVRARVALTHAMTKWLQSIYQPIERGPNEYPTWFRAGLCDNDEARRAVCDWITQHMYYHTDSVLQRMGFHPSDQSPMQEFVFDTSKGYIEYIYRDRCIHYASLNRVLEAYRRLCHTSSMPFVAANRQRLDASILGDEYIYSRHHGVNDNLVHREFVSENRVVFVQHSIHDDPKHPLTPLHRHKANWIVLDVIGPDVVMETKVFQKSQTWTKETGYLSLLDEANISVCEYHAEQLRQKSRPVDVILKEHLGEAFSTLMETVNQELQTSMLLLDLGDRTTAH